MTVEPAPAAEDRVGQLPGRLVDDFARNLFVGAQRVLADHENPVRLHMFASTVRELFSYTLHSLAPDEEVKACTWFERDPNTDKLTRRQRLMYAIQGGLDPDFVSDTLLLEIDDMCAGVIRAIDELSRFTHVRPDTLVTDAAEIAAHGERTLFALADFVDDMSDCRAAIASALEAHVHDAVFEAVSAETLPELDEISSHYSIEEHYVDDIVIIRINSEWIYMDVKGSVSVGLQWGSNSDIRNDMGAVAEETFPFNAGLKAPAGDPTQVETDEDGPAAVDTSSWWESYYDPEDDFRDPEVGGEEPPGTA